MAQFNTFSDPTRIDLSTPGSILGAGPNWQTPPYAGEAQAPFVWGQGGARLTPEQLAQQQKQATALQQADYSPIASPWQGLARVANNALGAYEQKGLDKEAQAQQADTAAVIAALGSSDPAAQSSAVAQALSGNEPTAQKYALQVDARLHPKPVNNDTVADYQFIGQMLGPDAAKQYLQGKADPIVNIPQPGGGVYMGPRSGMTASASQAQPVTKTLSNGQTAYFVNGDWYDNPEGK